MSAAPRPAIALMGPSEHDREEDRDRLAASLAAFGFEVERHPLGAPPPAAASAIVVNTKTRVDAAWFEAMPRLELVVTSTSGHDHIDLDAARARGVRVARCPLARRDAVVDASLALALALLRRLPRCQDGARGGRWIRAEMKDLPIHTVRGLRVGVFGLGVIGSRATDVWRALGAEVIGSDPAVAGSAAPAELFTTCDVLTLHCSRTPSSFGLVDAAAIAAMRPGAVLVNTARGDCVDLDAALAAPHLGGLGLDVFTGEPPPDLARVAARPDVLVTPHSAGYHAGLHRAVHDEVVATIRAWREGDAVPGLVA